MYKTIFIYLFLIISYKFTTLLATGKLIIYSLITTTLTLLFLEFWAKGSRCQIAKEIPSSTTKYFTRLDPLRCSYQTGPLSTVKYNKNRTQAKLLIFTHRFGNYTGDPNMKVSCKYRKQDLDPNVKVSF